MGGVDTDWDFFPAVSLLSGTDCLLNTFPPLGGGKVVKSMRMGLVEAYISSKRGNQSPVDAILSELDTKGHMRNSTEAASAMLECLASSVSGALLSRRDKWNDSYDAAQPRETLVKMWIMMTALENAANSKSQEYIGGIVNVGNIPEIFVHDVMGKGGQMEIMSEFNKEYPLIDWGIVPVKSASNVVHMLLAVRSSHYAYTFCVGEQGDDICCKASIVDVETGKQDDIKEREVATVEDGCAVLKGKFLDISKELGENVVNMFVLPNRNPEDLLHHGHSIWSTMAHAFLHRSRAMEELHKTMGSLLAIKEYVGEANE